MNTVWSHLHVESKNDQLIETESRVWLPGAGGWRNWGEELVKVRR